MKSIFCIEGKTALVTGGTRGLGFSMAEALMEEGASVVIWGTNEKVHSVSEGFVKRGFSCKGFIVDLKDKSQREFFFNETIKTLGRLDILVNCAGIQRRHVAEDFPLSDWDEVIEVNQTAPFHLCQLAGKKMIEQGGGKIINIASMASFFGGYTIPAYAASKGAVAQFTKGLCNEWASKNINVNAIAPGYMDTEMNTALTNVDNPRHLEITSRIPAKRWGTGDDMKGICIFLASSASDYVNGAIIPVDGGYLVR